MRASMSLKHLMGCLLLSLRLYWGLCSPIPRDVHLKPTKSTQNSTNSDAVQKLVAKPLYSAKPHIDNDVCVQLINLFQDQLVQAPAIVVVPLAKLPDIGSIQRNSSTTRPEKFPSKPSRSGRNDQDAVALEQNAPVGGEQPTVGALGPPNPGSRAATHPAENSTSGPELPGPNSKPLNGTPSGLAGVPTDNSRPMLASPLSNQSSSADASSQQSPQSSASKGEKVGIVGARAPQADHPRSPSSMGNKLPLIGPGVKNNITSTAASNNSRDTTTPTRSESSSASDPVPHIHPLWSTATLFALIYGFVLLPS